MPEGSEKALQKFETKMLDLLNSDATADCKNYIMKEISWMGSDKSIPTLEELSKNKDTAEMAKFALDRIQ